MSCSIVRQNLLAQETLKPEAPQARHLLGCAACRAWHRRLVRIEQQLPLVAVPVCPVPASLLDCLQSSPPSSPPGISRAMRLPGRHRNLEGGRQKLALAFSLAASLAVFTVGWWAWPHQSALSIRPVAAAPDAYRKLLDLRLPRASTAPQRAAVVADLADEFFAEVRQKGDDPARVALLARQFDRLVLEDLIHHVGLVSPTERRAVASSIAWRMSQVQSEATRLALKWTSRHESTVASLRRIATSARAAEERLRRFA